MRSLRTSISEIMQSHLLCKALDFILSLLGITLISNKPSLLGITFTSLDFLHFVGGYVLYDVTLYWYVPGCFSASLYERVPPFVSTANAFLSMW